jgi:hypothetical protein
MVYANCRARFTVPDFNFMVQALCGSRSARDRVSLVDLLSDPETLDQVLDHEALLDAVLNGPSQLSISQQFYFYVLTRHIFMQNGLTDRMVADYVASLLWHFSKTPNMFQPGTAEERSFQYLSDLLLALQEAQGSEAFMLRVHMGNYALFMAGIFHESLERRRRRGGPDCSFYEGIGSASFAEVARHGHARRLSLNPIYEQLSSEFRGVRKALNQFADRLIHLGDARHLSRIGNLDLR